MTDRSRFALLGGWVFLGLWFVCCGLLLGALAARWNDGWEPLSNLRFPLALGAGLGAAVAAFRTWQTESRRWGWGWGLLALFGTVIALLGVWPGARLYVSAPVPGSEHSATLRLGSANLLFGIAHPRPIRAWMDAEDLDVVGFVELKTSERSKLRWPKLLESWREDYPHQFVATHDYYGMAILSRTPLLQREVELSEDSLGDEYQRPIALQATLDWDGRPLTLVLVHPPRPQDSWRLQVRKNFLESLATRLGTESSCVVFGDFNSTEGSPFFQRLLAQTGLQDSRVGHGVQPTWSPHWFWLPLVPLDHILVRGPRVLSRGVGPQVRSDHRPVHASLAWPNPSKSNPSPN